jgi:hypothetical protein
MGNANGHSGLMSRGPAYRVNPDGEAGWLPQEESPGVLRVEREPRTRRAAER